MASGRGQRHWVPAFAGMTARRFAASLAALALAFGGNAFAQDPGSDPGQAVLIRNATVHTATARGTLQGADVLVRDGRIAAVGQGLSAGNARVLDAQGKPLTPALFGGITGIGIEGVSGRDRQTDNTSALGEGRAEERGVWKGSVRTGRTRWAESTTK